MCLRFYGSLSPLLFFLRQIRKYNKVATNILIVIKHLCGGKITGHNMCWRFYESFSQYPPPFFFLCQIRKYSKGAPCKLKATKPMCGAKNGSICVGVFIHLSTFQWFLPPPPLFLPILEVIKHNYMWWEKLNIVCLVC